MGNDQQAGVTSEVGAGGFSAAHPKVTVNPILVGPATSDEHNVVSTNLVPIACFRVEDIRFEFDSSFVRPEIANEMGQLAALRDEHKLLLRPNSGVEPVPVFPPLSVFGHADPVGNDAYNKVLSGRRAVAIFGLLTRKVSIWEELFSQPHGQDDWHTKGRATIEETLRLPPGTLTPVNRASLMLAYMDELCTLRDDAGRPLLDQQGNPVRIRLAPTDFLARGADAGGKGDHQGCSEFNPVRLLSQAEADTFAASADNLDRNAANAPNRRVMILLFRPGSRVKPGKWPCPRSSESAAGCIKRFWSDGEKRRSRRLADERREFKKTQDTFACRFYQRLTDKSPCERLQRGVAIYRVTHELDGKAVANTLFEIQFPDGRLQRLRSDDDGVIRMAGVEGQTFTMVAIDDEKQPGTLKDKGVPKVAGNDA